MGSGGFSSPFSAQRYYFFVFLSWHGLKYFLLLRKLDDKVISPWALKLMTLQTVYKGVEPRGAVTGRIGWWERSFSCRSTRTSKPVYFRKIARPYLITEHLMKNTNLERTSVRHRRIRKLKTTLWKKGNVRPQLLKSAAVPTTQGQRYAKPSCQEPTNKYNTWNIANKMKVRSSNECWPRLIQICNEQLNISPKGYPQFFLTGPVPGPCRNGFRPKYNSDMASEMRSKPEAKKIHDCRTCECVIKVRRYQGPV